METLRKTKIICTIGPATNTEEKITELVEAGMNVARLNFSHGTHESHQKVVDILKKVREKLGVPLAIMLDTNGPEFRIKTFKNDSVVLKEGNDFTFTSKEVQGNEKKVSLNYKNFAKSLKKGDTILANDGLIKFKVKKIKNGDVVCKVKNGGVLSNNKSLNVPNVDVDIEYLGKKDKKDLLFATKNKLEYIACSFVSEAQDLKDVRKFIDKNGGEEIDLIAKIENQMGIDNLEEICEECCGVMVARGDLGVEVDYDKLPVIQKNIVRYCKKQGKCVIISTEMLESIIENPRPTRAEISDVANAVYDGASATMLSGETAAGKYPIDAVEIMSKIAVTTEADRVNNFGREELVSVVSHQAVDAVAHATCVMAWDVEAKGIVNFTESGHTSKLISSFRPHVDVVSVTGSEAQFHKLALYWGLNPVLLYIADDSISIEKLYKVVDMSCKEILGMKKDDNAVVCLGWRDANAGYTNALKVQKI